MRLHHAMTAIPVAVVTLNVLTPTPAEGQGLADFDLSFQGVMLDAGYVSSSRVKSTASFGGGFDLGLLGPGVRVVAGFNHWPRRWWIVR